MTCNTLKMQPLAYIWIIKSHDWAEITSHEERGARIDFSSLFLSHLYGSKLYCHTEELIYTNLAHA